MKIDRRRFLYIALAMGLGNQAGCTIVEQPSQQQTTTGGESRPVSRVGYIAGPADECVEWDPSGECVGWADNATPADECVEWDPSGECIGWSGDDYVAPADECIEWDPSGECINWAPVDEA